MHPGLISEPLPPAPLPPHACKAGPVVPHKSQSLCLTPSVSTLHCFSLGTCCDNQAASSSRGTPPNVMLCTRSAETLCSRRQDLRDEKPVLNSPNACVCSLQGHWKWSCILRSAQNKQTLFPEPLFFVSVKMSQSNRFIAIQRKSGRCQEDGFGLTDAIIRSQVGKNRGKKKSERVDSGF